MIDFYMKLAKTAKYNLLVFLSLHISVTFGIYVIDIGIALMYNLNVNTIKRHHYLIPVQTLA